MKVIQTNLFESQAKNLTGEEQKELKNILIAIQNSKSIADLKSTSLIGFPFLHKIEFGKYVLGIHIKNDEVVLAGIVAKGNELSIFI